MSLDKIDRKILTALQLNARLSDEQLSEIVHLPAPKCGEHRAKLEADGFIAGYHAVANRDMSGFAIIGFVSIILKTDSIRSLEDFTDLVINSPHILEANTLIGELEYLVKIAASDLESLSKFVNDTIAIHPAVGEIKTSISMDTVKETTALPLLAS